MTSATLGKVLTAFLVVVHLALTAVDFFGVYPVADFLVRPDGSRQDPANMLPSEEIMVALVAFPFFIVVLGFTMFPQSQAALLSLAVHGVYAFHQIWKKDKWDALVHPDSEQITTDFFIISHIFWMVVSVIILSLSETVAFEKQKIA